MTSGSKAILAYLFQIGRATILWSSKNDDLVPLSVYEGELQALARATQEAIWLRHFIEEVLQANSMPIMIHCDNQAAVQ